MKMGLTDSPNAIGAVTKALKAFLETDGVMPDLEQALVGWPAPNQKLAYPSVTIFPKKPIFSPLAPYIVSRGTPDPTTHIAQVTKVIGMYDFSMQLDLWAAYRPQRDGLVEQLIGAFNQNPDVPGISFRLADYFNEPVHLTIQAVEYVDSNESVARNEWRALVTVLANMRLLRSETAYLIEEIENTLETPNELDADVVTPPPLTI
jgi:hypothetical protein